MNGSPTAIPRRCPYCGADLSGSPLTCPACNEDMTEEYDESQGRRHLDRLHQDTERAARDVSMAELARQAGGRFRTGTIVAAGITLTCVLLVVVFVVFQRSFPGEAGGAMAIAAGIIGFVVAIVVLCMGIADLRIPSWIAVAKPSAALAAFMRSLRLRRYPYAHACLTPLCTRDVPAPPPELRTVPVPEDRYDLTSFRDFRRYWRSFTVSGSGQSRTYTCSRFRLVSTDGPFALVNCRVQLTSYPTILILTVLAGLLPAAILIWALTKRETLTVSKLLVNAQNRWWVVSSELLGPEDRLAARVLADAGPEGRVGGGTDLA